MPTATSIYPYNGLEWPKNARSVFPLHLLAPTGYRPVYAFLQVEAYI